MEKLAKFVKLGLSDIILQALKKKGFEEPTPIQEKIIPLLLSKNRDVVGQAHTGTGKTAAFGIPILERLKENANHVQALVLVPTRELAIQVAEEINSLKGKRRLQIIPIYGGQSIELQLKMLNRGVDIVVGTPGRLLDHIRRRRLDLSEITYAVLDEADEMLNLGFIDDVEKILAVTNPGRTTLLFSATISPEILAIAERHMKDYEKFLIGGHQLTIDLTDQIYFEVRATDKFEALCRIIDFENEFYGLIFCRTKVDVNQISSHLKDRGYDAAALHGDISQSEREKILEKFKRKQLNLLVATDVAARGIDIQDLTHVINYAIPQDADSYVHRIGRTGRAGKEGTAITFITPEEYRKLMYIKKTVSSRLRKAQLPNIQDVIDAKSLRIRSEIEKIAASEISKDYLQLAHTMLEHSAPENAVAALLQYTFKGELDPGSYNEIRDVYPEIQGKTRLFVARGKKDRMTKQGLVDFIRKKTQIDQRKINDVEVLDSFSFITVPFKEAEIIFQSFKMEKRGGEPVVKLAKKRQHSDR